MNKAFDTPNGQYSGSQPPIACNPGSGVNGGGELADRDEPIVGAEQELTLSLTLAPNPASREVALELSGLEGLHEVVLEVRNALGQLVLVHKYAQVSDFNERLNVSGMASGLYFVSIWVDNQRMEQRLVVARD